MIPPKSELQYLELQRLLETGVSWDNEDWEPAYEYKENDTGTKLRHVNSPQKNDESVDPLVATYNLVDMDARDDVRKLSTNRVLQPFNLRVRKPPGSNVYGPGHCVATSFSAQQLDDKGILAGLLFMEELKNYLNRPWCGFFNAFAPSHQGFHFQYLCEDLPIWKCQRKRIFSMFDDTVTIASVEGWSIRAQCFSSESASAVAVAVWFFVKERLASYDLLLRFDGTEYSCIPVQRSRRRPLPLCVATQGECGDFGGLELSGVILIKSKSVFEKLQKEKDLPGRIRSGFKYTCVED